MKKIILVIFLLSLMVQACAQPAISYEDLKTQIENKRLSIYEEYKKADDKQKDSLLKLSHDYLFVALLNDVFPAWYGTRWEFHGHTKTPKQGAIACGYFITTTLQDVGFKIPRVKWAQMESERIIRKMTSDIKRFHNAEMKDVIKYINDKGDGLYIVGLDQHVGFISKHKDKLRFIHSNYYRPETGVMAEALMGWNPLSYSKYRVIGKILDKVMLEKWLIGYQYE